jgi:Zn-dependent metalloprotease
MKQLALILLLCVSFMLANAQQSDTLEIQRNKNGDVTYARFKSSESRKLKNGVAFLKQILKETGDDDFKLIKEDTDKLGIVHLRYQQYYKGIKVNRAEFSLHGKAGNIETVNGHYANVFLTSAEPAFGEKQALQKVLSFVNAKKYKWEDAAMERFAKQNSKNPNATYYPKGELIIVKDSINNFQLAWKFVVSTLEPNDELLVIINAITGKLISKRTLILDNNVTCVAQTLYSGDKNIIGDTYTGGIRLSEVSNNVTIHTLNMQNQLSNYTNASEFSNNNTNWTSGSWANINQDNAALDAHWAGETVFDYWHNIHQRNSIDGSGIPVTGYVHFFVPNSPAGWPNNAAWVPGNNGHFMEYGDGDGITFRPFVALDIAAHEFGHGVNEFTSDLGATTNGLQEEDALNEGLSDIWGICVKNFAAPNKPLWLSGGEILLNSAYNCIRNAQDPKSTLASEGQHPDTYQGQYWSSNGEPHTNSTVLSHWFYLLAQGISGGIGINKAEQIVYQAEAHYLQPGDEYADARNAMITASTDLYCANSPEVKAVTNAWYAVGVGSQYSGQITTMNVSDPICTSATATLQNQPSGITSLVWSTDNSYNLSINSSGVATRVGSFNGDATIYAVLQGSTCSTTVSANIHVGLPDAATGITINSGTVDPMSLCANTEYAAFVNPAVYTDYKWTLPNDWPLNSSPIYTQDDMIQFVTGDDNTGGYLTVQKINSCGMSSPYYIQVGVSSYNCQNFLQFTISPNPATNSIIITSQSQQQNKKLKTIQSVNAAEVAYIKEVKIYNSAGKLQKQQIFSGKASQVKMDISNLLNGVYFIEISDWQQHKTTQKLLINK